MKRELRDELIAMAKEDQQVLSELAESGELGTVEYHPRMKAVHEKNNQRIKEIINIHGWPYINLVGDKASEAAWLIAQHAVLDSTFMGQCLPLLSEAVKKGEAKGWCYAYLQDRVLTSQDKPQIYGTQHDFNEMGMAYPLPIKDPKEVHKLRKKIGLVPLEEATERIQKKQDAIKKNREKLTE